MLWDLLSQDKYTTPAPSCQTPPQPSLLFKYLYIKIKDLTLASTSNFLGNKLSGKQLKDIVLCILTSFWVLCAPKAG